jgi:plastocyanin
MPGHIATVALATLATLATLAAAAPAPAHAARAHRPLSRHVGAASSFGPAPSPPSTAKATTQRRSQRVVRARAIHHRVAHATADPAVTIADFHFTPPSTTVHVGDTITWTNDGPSSHTATASDGSFNTGTLRKGQSASHTFTKPGTYAYVCTIHPFMHGTITVLAAATSTPAPTTTPTTTPAPTTTTSGAPTSATPQTLATKPARAETAKPTLPVTGMDVLGAIMAGAILVGSGLALRRAVA